MATYYLDLTGGNDANNGTSFAQRWLTWTNGPTAARTAPGDTIRVMSSPAPTSLGINGTWSTGPTPASFQPTSSTNATPIVMTKAGHGLVTGDTILVGGHFTNTNANGVWDVTVSGNDFTLLNADGTNSVGNGVGGQSGTIFKINSSRIKLASALTKTIALTGNQGMKTNWTASANVTCTISSNYWKEGYASLQLQVGSAFTTGKAAYYPLGSAVDFSAYKQISFWIMQYSGTVGAAGDCTISLCSDALGATPVNTFNIPNLYLTSKWTPITLDNGAALGSSIQSIAFNVVTDNGAQDFYIDHIIACKDSASADSLTLQSLIGKNTGSNDTFISIQSINSTRVMLDELPYTTMPYVSESAPFRGYYGTAETVTAYKRETFKYPGVSTAQSVTLNEGGSAGNYITYSGGWNTTDMSTQTGQTWLDGLNGATYGFYVGFLSYLRFENFGVVRFYQGYTYIASNCQIVGGVIQHCYYGINPSTMGNVILSLDSMSYNYQLCNTALQNSVVTLPIVWGTGNAGLYLGNGNTYTLGDFAGCVEGVNIQSTHNQDISFTDVRYCTVGISFQSGGNASGTTRIYARFTSNTTDVACLNAPARAVIRASSDSTTLTCTAASIGYSLGRQGSFYTTVGTGVYYGVTPYGNINSEATIRHTAAGIAWKMSLTTATYIDSATPWYMPIGLVQCKASVLTTVSLWMRRTNTGLTAQLICKRYQIAGVNSNVTASMTVAADTWEKVTITFTPTETGIVEIGAQCYGGTTYSLYIDDLTINGALRSLDYVYDGYPSACSANTVRGTITGNIDESTDITAWRFAAFDQETNELAGTSTSTGTTYSIDCTSVGPTTVTMMPKVDYTWSAGKTTTAGDYVCAVSVDTTPHIWQCTVGGITHATTEPTWNLTGTTTDNTTTWTYVAPLVDPVSLGPLTPT